MTAVQLFLFEHEPRLQGRTSAVAPQEPQSIRLVSENVLVQELMDKGAWTNRAQLNRAIEDLREEVMQNGAYPDSFMLHESRAALKLVSERLKQL